MTTFTATTDVCNVFFRVFNSIVSHCYVTFFVIWLSTFDVTFSQERALWKCIIISSLCYYCNLLVSLPVMTLLIDAEGLRFTYRVGQIEHTVANGSPRLRRSSELCCPGAMPWRWTPPLVTRFGVTTRV